MINFRYHIVSLVAVFLALAVGITLGATILGGRINAGIVAQAAQDRKTVQDQRAELTQRRAIQAYSDDYARLVAPKVMAGALSGQEVAIIAMPDAPGAVVDSLATAVKSAGGTVTAVVSVRAEALDPARATDVLAAVNPYAAVSGFDPQDPVARKFGRVLARGFVGLQTAAQDATGTTIANQLKGARLISVSGAAPVRARLAVVVAGPTTQDRPTNDVLTSHVQLDIAIADGAGGVVVAGPNSEGIDGTDVASVRGDPQASDLVSTVDVADLSSGVTTVVLALRERTQGKQGHYGASATFRDAVAPGLQ